MAVAEGTYLVKTPAHQRKERSETPVSAHRLNLGKLIRREAAFAFLAEVGPAVVAET